MYVVQCLWLTLAQSLGLGLMLSSSQVGSGLQDHLSGLGLTQSLVPMADFGFHG